MDITMQGVAVEANSIKRIALAILLCVPFAANAIPITYQIKFTALTGTVTTRIFPEEESQQDPTVHIEDATGNVYFGLFSVDDAILQTDGINKIGNLQFFYIQMEDNIWAYNLAGNNSFEGFRGPDPSDPSCTGCFLAPSPGFDVVNGAITNLRGGVYGEGDEPFVDFSFQLNDTPNFFNAHGYNFINWGGTSSHVDIQGTMEIFRVPVPEPAALPLFGIGLILVLGLGDRRCAR